jgi:hypothetical protein
MSRWPRLRELPCQLRLVDTIAFSSRQVAATRIAEVESQSSKLKHLAQQDWSIAMP